MKNLWLLLSIIALFAVFVQSDDPHKPVRKPIDWTNPKYSFSYGRIYKYKSENRTIDDKPVRKPIDWTNPKYSFSYGRIYKYKSENRTIDETPSVNLQGKNNDKSENRTIDETLSVNLQEKNNETPSVNLQGKNNVDYSFNLGTINKYKTGGLAGGETIHQSGKHTRK